MAKLYFRYGAMNSGKSTALMQVAYNYQERGMSVLVLKPAVDTKGGSCLISRLGVTREVDICVPAKMDLYQQIDTLCKQRKKPACILADESQFFTAMQIEQLFLVAVQMDIPVICYGLRTDFCLKGFAGSTRLLELAHEIEEMKTICTCGKKALCNARMVNGEFVFEGDQVAIDQQDNVQYQSLCASCYFEKKQNSKKKLAH